MKALLACCAICATALSPLGAQASKMADSSARHGAMKKGDGMMKQSGGMMKKTDGMAKKTGGMMKKSDGMAPKKDSGMADTSRKATKKLKNGKHLGGMKPAV